MIDKDIIKPFLFVLIALALLLASVVIPKWQGFEAEYIRRYTWTTQDVRP
jgi:hypothetical protein